MAISSVSAQSALAATYGVQERNMVQERNAVRQREDNTQAQQTTPRNNNVAQADRVSLSNESRQIAARAAERPVENREPPAEARFDRGTVEGAGNNGANSKAIAAYTGVSNM